MKVCVKCGTRKGNSEFNKSTKNKDGLHSYCRNCQHEYNKSFMAKKQREIQTSYVKEKQPEFISVPALDNLKSHFNTSFTNNIQRHIALESCTDKELFNELKRRGFSGKLMISKTVEF